MNINRVFSLLDLNYVGMEKVREYVDEKCYGEALEELRQYFLTRKNALYLKDNEIEKIKNYCIENFSEDVKETIEIADQVKDKTFLFRFRWDMERTNVPFTFEDHIVWDKVPFEDEEWVFMLNRHKFWIALGQAYAITGEEEYAKSFCEQLAHWIHSNSQIEEKAKSTWRTIEAGVRCENWIKSYQYVKKSSYFTKELLAEFIESLYNHGEYIYNKYDNFRRLSNWGVLENHGLFVLSLFLPELKVSKLWQTESIKRLEEEIRLQVMRDGVHWEQSPMYHNEVLHCFLDTINLAEKKNINLPQIIIDKTRDLAFADLYMAKPNHHQPMQSDSDDTDLRDMLTQAAVIFKDSHLKFSAYDKVDFHSVWDLGIGGIDIYERLIAEEPEQLSCAFSDSGNYYMRTSWDEDANYLYFHCGTLGSGHGHGDLLHFDLVVYGEDLLVDPGRYTYVEGNPWRLYFKGCRAHNTTIVDEKEFTVFKDSWSIQKAAMPVKQSFYTHKDYDYVEGAHLGYMDLENPVYVSRKIIFVKPSYWVLVDEFYGNGTHNYQQLFHFSKGNIESCSEDKIIYSKNNVKLNLIQLNKENMHYKVEEAFISPEYNKIEKSPMLTYKVEKQGFTSLITILHAQKCNEQLEVTYEKIPVYKGTGELIENEEAEAIKINIGKDEQHIILVAHGERAKGKKLYVVDDIPVYGKVILIKKVHGNIQVETIKY